MTLKKPNLFIVGKQKSGTTAIYDMLRQHPDIYMPGRKELGYFDKDNKKRDIKSKSKLMRYFKNSKNEKYLGEASAGYLDSKTAAKEIKKFNSNSKIIILLREPLEYLRSLYQHISLRGREERKLKDFLESKETLEKLKYSSQIKRYLKNFKNKNIKIILYEDFKKNNSKIFKEVCSFLDIDSNFKPKITKRNASRIKRKNIISRILARAPLYKTYLFIDKHFPLLIKNKIFSIGTKIMFKRKQISISPKLKIKLKKQIKPEVKKVNELLHKEGFLPKKRDLVKKWGYEEIK